MMFNYPLELSFKVLALPPQLAVTDAAGQLLPSLLMMVLLERGRG